MGLWRGREPVTVEHTVAPRDVVPVDTAETIHAELLARIKHAARLAERKLFEQSGKPEWLRDVELVDLCLDVRSALRPSAPGSEVLRELPPVPVRYAVPVTPGRAS